MGHKYGRVIQAVYWGNGLHVQFSQLMNFKTDKEAIMELFCRYVTGDRIGYEEKPLLMSGPNM